MPLKEDYRSGQPLAAISARWLNEVAHILNTLQIEMTGANELPTVQRPVYPGKWTLRIPQGGTGAGLPEGTEIWGKVRAERLTGSSAPQGDGTYFYQARLVWDGAAFVPKEGEDGEPVEELVAFVPDATGGGLVVGNPTIEAETIGETQTLWENWHFGQVQTDAEGNRTISWDLGTVAWRREVTTHANDHTAGVI